jgi:hypothetical protein
MHLGRGYDSSASYDLLGRAFDLKTQADQRRDHGVRPFADLRRGRQRDLAGPQTLISAANGHLVAGDRGGRLLGALVLGVLPRTWMAMVPGRSVPAGARRREMTIHLGVRERLRAQARKPWDQGSSSVRSSSFVHFRGRPWRSVDTRVRIACSV